MREIAGKAKLIVDFDQEVGQFHAAHVLRQPGFEVSQTVLSLLVQFLAGLGGQPPAILVNHGVAVARCRLEKALIGFAEAAREILRYLLGIGGQTRTAKKVLTYSLPTVVVDEELLQPREPFAVADREIAGLELVAQLEQQGALPGPPVNLAVVYDDGLKALR